MFVSLLPLAFFFEHSPSYQSNAKCSDLRIKFRNYINRPNCCRLLLGTLILASDSWAAGVEDGGRGRSRPSRCLWVGCRQ